MKRYVSLVLMLCLLVRGGAEPTPPPDTAAAQSVGEADNATVTAEPPTATNTPRPTTDTPAFTDSGRIAFTSDRDGNKEIYAMDSSGQTRLTDNPAEDRWPAWSPDGTEIAFTTTLDRNNDEIFVMNADGSG